jgi:hypothetical protein
LIFEYFGNALSLISKEFASVIIIGNKIESNFIGELKNLPTMDLLNFESLWI